jgi:prevent-host-death family protein
VWLDDYRTALYRLYDEAGVLLYIGISHQPEVRFEQHAKFKEWWPQVVRREVEWFDDRPTAAAAEATAIRGEDPAHNGTYSPRRDRHTARDVVGDDGVREISASLVRPKLSELVRSVQQEEGAVVILEHGRRAAVIVSQDFYRQALALRAQVLALTSDS